MNFKTCVEAITRQYPQLKEASFSENQKGWSNFVIRTDNHLIFRFPRNEDSKKALANEKVLVPYLRNKTGLNIPNFEYLSEYDSLSFVGYELIAGEEFQLNHIEELDLKAYQRIVKDVARFLTALHKLSLKELGLSPQSLDNMHNNWSKLRDQMMIKGRVHFSYYELEWINRFFKKFLIECPLMDEDLKIIHGDFSSDHILLNTSNMTLGFIDFGDVCLGDPAFDFTGLYRQYGKQFCLDVLKEYEGELPEGFMKRLESFYIKQVPFHLYLHGMDLEDQDIIEAGVKQVKDLVYSMEFI